jgi:RNA polymerase sigma factor (sigma-70 family)
MVAMVLGTALSAMPGMSSAAQAEDGAARAVANMGKYCTTCWRNARLPADAWGDCTQEVFARLLERVPTSKWGEILGGDGEERLEFLRAIDAVKKRTQRARKTSGAIDQLADPRMPRDSWLGEEREAVSQAAKALLSSRQQRIVRMSLEGWSVHEMASALGMPPARVSDEKYKAVRKLQNKLAPGSSWLPA